MQSPDMPIALDRGDVDAFFIWQPFGLQSKKLSGDKVHELTTGKGLMRGYAVLAADAKWLKENTETATKFLAAIQDGINWIKANPEKTIKMVTKKYGTDESLARHLFERENYSLAIDPEFHSTFNDLAGFLRKIDLLKSELDWNTLFNGSALRGLDPGLITAPVE
jgi:ABC-type nitrate/sulfonate/bicarbonate transport system substrate-binding protein